MKIKSLHLLTYLLLTTIIHAQNKTSWQSLFNGKNLDGWHTLAGTATYKVEDGAIVGSTMMDSPNTFLVYDKKFAGDFILELEAKVQDTSMNSGVQFRSNYNAEDNKGKGKVFGYQFEIDPAPRDWSGGIYDEGRREWLYPTALNARAQHVFKLGEYNKIRIECIDHTIKTWLNGIGVAYFIDTLKDNQGLIGLQVHKITRADQLNEKVYFKNIRIQTGKLATTPFMQGTYVVNLQHNQVSDYEKKDGWKLLFDGHTTEGWKGAYINHFPDSGWIVKDGALTVLSSEGKESTNGGDIVTTQEYNAFDLSFEFKLTPGANSGVKYFVTLSEHNQGSAIGLEYQVLDDSLHPDAKLGRDGNRTLASLYDLIPAQKQKRFLRPIGQWNIARVIVYPSNHVEHYLNGVKVLEYERGSQSFRDLVAISKFKIWDHFGEAGKGYILLQDHGNEVSYRSIKIRSLQ